MATTQGLLDDLPFGRLREAEKAIHAAIRQRAGAVCERIEQGVALHADDRQELLDAARAALSGLD